MNSAQVQCDSSPGKPLNPALIHTLSGAISGMTSRFFVAPLDVLKIRFQLQRQVHLYRGIFRSLSIIASQEGFKSLWKGNLSGELLWIVYSAQSFYVYEKSSSFLLSNKILPNNAGTRDLISGGVAGLCATIGSYPLDLVRTRLIAQHENQRVYRHIFEAFSMIYNQNGVTGFYRGVIPTVVSMIPYTAIQFATYKKLNRFLSPKNSSSDYRPSSSQTLITGIISSICAKVVCLPFDCTKKRLQVSHFSEAHSYEGVISCVKQTIQGEGLRAFYKGGVVSILKTGIGGGLSFMVYEFTKSQLSKYQLLESSQKRKIDSKIVRQRA